VTFYSGANYSGSAWNDPVRDPYDNSHVYDLSSVNPSANRHLGSFQINPVGHWHVVLYWGPGGSGNLVHFETSQPNLDSTDVNSTQSVKAYILGTSGSCYAY
jgi:hypothetical protein